MAAMIIGQKQTTFSPETFEDRYEEALLALVKSKIAGGQPVIAKAPERGNVVNLMDALRRSIEQERRPPAPSLVKPAAGPKSAPGKTAPANAAPDKAAPTKAAAKATAEKAAAPAAARKKKTA